MEVSNAQIGRLLAYCDATGDSRASALLDSLYESKIVLPLQRAFFKMHGYPFQVFLVNGTYMQVLGRAKCEETMMSWMSRKRTNDFQSQE